MTKIKRSYTIDMDLDNAVGRLATRLGQSNSQLIGNIIRNDKKITEMLEQLYSIKSMPDYTPKQNEKITA